MVIDTPQMVKVNLGCKLKTGHGFPLALPDYMFEISCIHGDLLQMGMGITRTHDLRTESH